MVLVLGKDRKHILVFNLMLLFDGLKRYYYKIAITFDNNVNIIGALIEYQFSIFKDSGE